MALKHYGYNGDGAKSGVEDVLKVMFSSSLLILSLTHQFHGFKILFTPHKLSLPDDSLCNKINCLFSELQTRG